MVIFGIGMLKLISLALFCSCIVTASVCDAQKSGVKSPASKTKAAPKESAKPHKVFMPQSYLGSTAYFSGTIPVDVLAGLLKQGVSSRDTAGNSYKVVGFNFSYAERRIYEDSAANPMLVVDYLSEYCPGDTLSSAVSSYLGERLKPGDTLYYQNVSISKPSMENASIICKGMKITVGRPSTRR